MAIGNAVQRGGFVFIYDEKGRQTGSVNLGSDPKDGLKGYTSSVVNIQRSGFIHSCDEKGHIKSTIPAR
jgi:hypothetical protein